VVALGAVAKHLPIFTGDELKSAVRLYFKDKGKEKYNDLNSRAFDAGYYMELSP
jgi:Pyruvate/2-oxoacid:ferredoxin oxidoreductase gamma subunit